MKRLLVLSAALALAAPATGQDQAAVYQQAQKKAFRFAGDSLARYEWTQLCIPDSRSFQGLLKPGTPAKLPLPTAVEPRRR